MSKWTDRFSEHQVHSNIEEWINSVNALVDEDDGSSVEISEDLNRLQQAINLIKGRFDVLDPNLVPIQVLNNTDKFIVNGINSLNSFKNDRQVSHVLTSNNHVDSALMQISNLIFPQSPDDVENIKDSITALRRSAGQNNRYLSEELSKSKKEFEGSASLVEDLRKDINEQKGRLDTAISRFQEQFSKTEDSRREEFSKAEKERVLETKNAIDNFQSSFEDISNTLEDKTRQFSEAIEKSIEDQLSSLESKTTESVSHIESNKDKAAKLIGIISNTGMVGGYQSAANTKRNLSWFWQLVATLSLLGLIVFAIKAMNVTVDSGSFSWGVFSARVFVATAFGVLAAYASRQSDRNEKLEARYRKIELEMASINPYISELPSESQEKLREEFATKIFGSSESEPLLESEDKWNGSVVDLLKMAIKEMGSALKSK